MFLTFCDFGILGFIYFGLWKLIILGIWDPNLQEFNPYLTHFGFILGALRVPISSDGTRETSGFNAFRPTKMLVVGTLGESFCIHFAPFCPLGVALLGQPKPPI